MAGFLKRLITTLGFPGVSNGDPHSVDPGKRPYPEIQLLPRKSAPGKIEYISLINTSETPVKTTLFVLQGMERGLDARGVQQWEDLVEKHAVNVVLHNYPGYGGEKDRGIRCSHERLKEDCLQLLEEMRDWKWCGSTETVVLGNSIGTGPAMWLATETHSRNLGLKKIVLISAYTSLWALLLSWLTCHVRPLRHFRALLAGPHMLSLLQRPSTDPFPSLTLASGLRDLNVLIVHGAEDDTIPLSHSQAISAALAANPNIRTTSCIIPSADHRYTRPIAEDVIFAFVKGEEERLGTELGEVERKARKFLDAKQEEKREARGRGERREEMKD